MRLYGYADAEHVLNIFKNHTIFPRTNFVIIVRDPVEAAISAVRKEHGISQFLLIDKGDTNLAGRAVQMTYEDIHAALNIYLTTVMVRMHFFMKLGTSTMVLNYADILRSERKIIELLLNHLSAGSDHSKEYHVDSYFRKASRSSFQSKIADFAGVCRKLPPQKAENFDAYASIRQECLS
jgi:hypothetical protein